MVFWFIGCQLFSVNLFIENDFFSHFPVVFFKIDLTFQVVFTLAISKRHQIGAMTCSTESMHNLIA